MAPVTGKFVADFDSFYDAVEKAEVSLKSFEGGAATVQRRLNTLADGFSGRKVIQEASLVSEAIREIGGVSKLSTDEAARSLRTLEAGFEKMLKSGEEIPTSMMKTAAELRRVGTAADAADQSVSRISENYRKFDGILQSFGINIGPYVKGLEDMANLAKGAATGLGLLGAAASVVATAFGAWKSGTHIGEVTGLTKAIAEGTAALKGYGDVAQEEMLARQQSVELAGVAEANWKRQAESVAEATRASQAHTEQMQREGMATAGNAAHMAALANQLEAVKRKRDEDAMAARRQWPAIEGVTERTKALTEALTKQEQSLKATMDREAERAKQQTKFMQAETLNDRESSSVSMELRALSQTELTRLNEQYDPFKKGGNFGAMERLRQLEAREGTHAPKTKEQYLTMLNETAELARLRLTLQSMPSFKDGVENFSGGLAYVHKDEMLVNMPKGTSVIPAGGGMRGGFVLNGNVVINGASSRRDGELAGKAFIQFLKDSGQLIPGGVGA